MNAHQRRKERRSLKAFWASYPGLASLRNKGDDWPKHCAYKIDMTAFRQVYGRIAREGALKIHQAFGPYDPSIDYAKLKVERPAELSPFNDLSNYGKDGKRFATGGLVNPDGPRTVRPLLQPGENVVPSYLEYRQIESELELKFTNCRTTGNTVIGSIAGHDYELARNKSCQVVVWIDGRRSSRAKLFELIKG